MLQGTFYLLCFGNAFSGQIPSELPEMQINPRTIQMRLVTAKLSSRHLTNKILISLRNRRTRLVFTREHLNWTVKDWKNVLFNDKTRYNIFNSNAMKQNLSLILSTLHPRLNMAKVASLMGSLFLERSKSIALHRWNYGSFTGICAQFDDAVC
ncbi:hypothetical protein NQ318_016481 [Aromia moschata]|uniref:Transposase Tc1-like domain-containing protein n=1 Tax=Aromia moschata TaxID=1265417 RepID=A0AAV8Z6G6_9CUCU|nr:hypothetical protein NQ318_016481 [Aromia moschata]